MIFTQEQINEIKHRLAISGSKDPQLPLADLPLTGEETIALVQQGENKRVPIEEFYEEFSRYIDNSERVDFFNVSRYAQRVAGAEASVALTLPEAVELCPDDVRRGGQIITFVDTEGNWTLWQYQGTTPDNWTDTGSSWLNLESDPNLGIIFTVSDSTINVGETKSVYLHFETSDGGEASVVELLLNNEVFKTYRNISSFDLHQEISEESKFTVKAFQYGYTYEETHTILVSYPAWIGAGESYTDVMVDADKIAVTDTANGSYNITFDSTGYFIIVVPKSLVLGPITMSGFDVPMQATSTQKINDVDYSVYMSANQYVAGTHTFVVGTYSGTEKDLVSSMQQDIGGLQTLMGEQEETNQEQTKALDSLDNRVQKVEQEGLNTADNEDITLVGQKYKFADKDYSELDFSGLGRIYLRKNLQDIKVVDGNVTTITTKNILGQGMISKVNTIYHIQYDYDLNEGSITIPENCILLFEGGSITNGNVNLAEDTIVVDVRHSVGATEKRPTLVSKGFQYFDTTLNIPVYWTGSTWVNALGETV